MTLPGTPAMITFSGKSPKIHYNASDAIIDPLPTYAKSFCRFNSTNEPIQTPSPIFGAIKIRKSLPARLVLLPISCVPLIMETLGPTSYIIIYQSSL